MALPVKALDKLFLEKSSVCGDSEGRAQKHVSPHEISCIRETDTVRDLCSSKFAVRMKIAAQQQLFGAGDNAHFYLIERGDVIAHGRITDGASPVRSAVRFFSDGDLFIVNSGNVHVADCHTIHPCTVLRFERKSLDELALNSMKLQRLLSFVYENEIALVRSICGLRSADVPRQSE